MSLDSRELELGAGLAIPSHEIELTAIRAAGPGGQNVNKVSSAVHLRFDIAASSLPEWLRERLLALKDRRITRDGTLVIKAQRYRSQERNADDAYERLRALIEAAMVTAKPRRPTRPTRGSRERRLAGKAIRSRTKSLRKRMRTPED